MLTNLQLIPLKPIEQILKCIPHGLHFKMGHGGRVAARLTGLPKVPGSNLGEYQY